MTCSRVPLLIMLAVEVWIVLLDLNEQPSNPSLYESASSIINYSAKLSYETSARGDRSGSSGGAPPLPPRDTLIDPLPAATVRNNQPNKNYFAPPAECSTRRFRIIALEVKSSNDAG